jgi:hypothetical protein
MAANTADTAVDIARHFRGPCGLDPDADTAQLCDKDRPPARTGRGQPSRTASRSAGASLDVLVYVRRTRAVGTSCRSSPDVSGSDDEMSLLAPTLESFFTDRPANQRRSSPRTIASYRDTLKLLVVFVHRQTGKTPCALGWEDLDAAGARHPAQALRQADRFVPNCVRDRRPHRRSRSESVGRATRPCAAACGRANGASRLRADRSRLRRRRPRHGRARPL